MRRWLFALLLSTAAWGVAAASAPPLLAAVEPAPLRELIGGTMASVSWEGRTPPAHAYEWEMFLSLDGGKTFPIRLTPHLALAVRSLRFRVPDLPTGEGRLLLRFGDETRETVVTLTDRVTIVKGSMAPLPLRFALRPNEAARPGEPGVTLWTEGDPQGVRQETYAAELPWTSIHGLSPAPRLRQPQARGPRSSRLQPLQPDALGTERVARAGTNPETGLPSPPALQPIRQRIGRQNE